MQDEFDILAAKCLAGEASALEAERLHELIGQNEEFAEEYERLKATWKTVRGVAPAAFAMDSSPAPIPIERLRTLQHAVRMNFSNSRVESGSGDPVESKAVELQHSSTSSSNKFEMPRERREESAPVPILLGLWRHTLRLSRLHWAALGAAVALLVAGALFLVSRTHRQPEGSSHSVIVAYILMTHGQAEVHHAGTSVQSDSVVGLRKEDEIVLSVGAAAQMILPTGTFELRGPQRLKARTLQTKIGPAPSEVSSGTNSAPVQMAGKTFQSVLFQPIEELVQTTLLAATRSGQSIPLYSPIGATAYLTPLILWRGEAGKTYDLVIADQLNPSGASFQLHAAVPPVRFEQVQAWKGRSLASNSLYRLTILETGKPFTACEYTFRTIDNADGSLAVSPADRLLHAYRLLHHDSDRLGDVLANLMSLPAGFAETDFALKLKLYSFGKLGYVEDFTAVHERLQRLSSGF